MPTNKVDREPAFTNYGNHTQYQGGYIQYHDRNEGRQQIIEQLHGFGRIGRSQIEEHIHRYDGLPEQIEQHDLKGPEEYKKKQYPEHLSAIPGQGHNQIITTQR